MVGTPQNEESNLAIKITHKPLLDATLSQHSFWAPADMESAHGYPKTP
jgi:hypothetical protein